MSWAILVLTAVMASGGEDCGLPPLEFQRVSQAYDGGSLVVAVTDSAGCLVQFKIDYRIETQTRGRVYVGWAGLGTADSRLAGPNEEARLLGLLQATADHMCDREVQEAIAAKPFDKVALTEQDLWMVLHELKRH